MPENERFAIVYSTLKGNNCENNRDGCLGCLKRSYDPAIFCSVRFILATFVVFCRPFFTYWVTFVQIVCYIVSVVVYGLSPIGISVTTEESEVFVFYTLGMCSWLCCLRYDTIVCI